MKTEELNPLTILRLRASNPAISLESATRLLRAVQYLEETERIEKLVGPDTFSTLTIFELYGTASAAHA